LQIRHHVGRGLQIPTNMKDGKKEEIKKNPEV